MIPACSVLFALCALPPAQPEIDPVAQLAREFAAWRADLLTRDDGPAATRALLGLVQRGEILVSKAPAEDRRVRLLAQLYRAQLESLERSADLRGRLVLLARLSDATAAATRGGDAVVVARGRAAALALDSGGFARCVAELASAGAVPVQGGAESELLELTVAGALARGEVEFVQQLGPDAVGALVSLALRPRAPEVRGVADPLVALARIAPDRALDVAVELVADRGAIGRARVLFAFGQYLPLAVDAVWRTDGQGWSLVKPRWVTVLTGLIEVNPERTDLDRWIGEFVERDYAPPVVAALLPAWIGRGNSVSRPVPGVALKAARALYRDASAHSLRRAIEVIELGGSVAALWQRTEIRHPAARSALADAFGPRTVKVRKSDGATAELQRVPALDAAFARALERFVVVAPDRNGLIALQDALKTARARGASALDRAAILRCTDGIDVLDPAWLGALVDHAAWLPEVDRAAVGVGIVARIGLMSGGERAPDAALARLLAAVARTDGPTGVAKILASVDALPKVGRDLRERAARALARTLPELWAEDPSGYAELAGKLLDGASLDVLRVFVEADQERRTGVTPREYLGSLPPDLVERVVRGLVGHGYESLHEFDHDDFVLPPAVWLGMAGKPNFGPRERQWLLARLGEAQGERLGLEHAPALARAMVACGEPVLGYHQLDALGIPSAEVLRALLEPGVASDAFLCSFYAPIDSPDLLQRVLDRLPPSSWRKAKQVWLHRAILRALAERKDPAVHPQMLAANRPGSTLQMMLLEALEQVRSPVHLPVAGELLVTGRFRTRELRDRAIDWVASQQTDEAAQYLLEASRRWPDKPGRAALGAAFKDLVAWQEAQQRWRRGKGQAERRVAAVLRLRAMLDHAEPRRRVAALRGLAALAAVEELPRIIGCFEDPAADVQAAAKAAFERLTK